MDTTQKRRARGWILHFLKQESVGLDGQRAQVTPEYLQGLFSEVRVLISLDELMAECAYLAGKKLVECEQFSGTAAKVLGGRRMGVRITAAGVDVAEGTVADAGINLGIFAQG